MRKNRLGRLGHVLRRVKPESVRVVKNLQLKVREEGVV